MTRAKWIWLKGEFEIYHALLLNSRREEYGVPYPAMWHCDTPYANVKFFKQISRKEPAQVCIYGRGMGYARLGRDKYPLGEPFTLPAGDYELSVSVVCTDGTFPCIFCDSKDLVTDETWTASHVTAEIFPVGAMDEYTDKNDNPYIFKFEYSPLLPVSKTATEGGVLYDFGKETFARITLKNVPESGCELYYGESAEEALDEEEAVIRLKKIGAGDHCLHARALRYLQVKAERAEEIEVETEYEYLPLRDRADFACNRDEIKRIWDVCAYTFHLNSREFFLDGIKRDRWIWSGDAYQSYMANNYLYFDNNITKRTILALLGKPPFEQHVNTINDYTMYLIIAVEEYYRNTRDGEFVRFVWKRIRGLYDFLNGRVNERGYVCARKGDWIFIDWSPMDKSGELCAEQILFWRTKQTMAYLAELLGEDGAAWRREAEVLREKILQDFWSDEKKAFIDCYTSGRNNVTRHANIFAILYDFVDRKTMDEIMENVLKNDRITPITTPYFEFFELMAYGKLGELEHIQDKIESYWGGILSLGGTSIWEQFDPTKEGLEHYGMYGKKFGCSLCHAWGSGPIYLLGRFCVGVFPTDVGYRTFRVEPNPGKYESFEGRVPLPEGEVTVSYADGKITVTAGAEGGTLAWKGKEYALKKNVPLTV